MNRRKFLKSSALASAAVLARRASWGEPVSVRLTLDRHRRGNPIPADFTGLSYEAAQLGDPTFFSPENTELIGFIRRLGGSGVLRIGGNTSEYSYWTPQGAQTENQTTRERDEADVLQQAVAPDTGHGPAKHRGITPQAIQNLAGFVQAT
ncbi:MAG TPA: hypothetical protein VFE06_05735, partial [Acidobacteriaceae bacterium]|nr:hypothetical protein [Acidobacteriaceae bacterium]